MLQKNIRLFRGLIGEKCFPDLLKFDRKWVRVILSFHFMFVVALSADARPRIEEIVMARGPGGAFILDSDGRVWGFTNPLAYRNLIQICGVQNIKNISPYAAIDKNGKAFTWSISNYNASVYNDADITVSFDCATPNHELKSSKLIDAAITDYGQKFVALESNGDLIQWYDSHGKFHGENSPWHSWEIAPPKVLNIIDAGNVVALSIFPYGLAVVFSDNSVARWTQIYEKNANLEKVIMAGPGEFEAKFHKIRANNYHTVAISEVGDVIFWGRCAASKGPWGFSSFDINDLKPTMSPIRDVSDVAMSVNDDKDPDIYLKLDGSLWAALAPENNDVPGARCERRKLSARKLKSEIQAISVVTDGVDDILILDSHHHLWLTQYYNPDNLTPLQMPQFE